MLKSGVIFSLALMVAANCSQLQAQECDEECQKNVPQDWEFRIEATIKQSEATLHLLDNIKGLQPAKEGLSAGLKFNSSNFIVGPNQSAKICLWEIVADGHPVDRDTSPKSGLTVSYTGQFSKEPNLQGTLEPLEYGPTCHDLPAQAGEYEVILHNSSNLRAVVATLTLTFIDSAQ
ncbi:hypothetical protein [Kordiimonas gwangyangensis]|uniref:hypothetical protein n=1 Tax=Kordiimonas gwangyangensis TaxID=288022 RepID=UPI000369D2C6|nr:hypothetical protein [Kordiimonas gwangyangensis]